MFKAASEITDAMQEARRMAASEVRRVRRMADLLKLTDTELIEHLVDTRGNLHHHALPRKKGSWHPGKNREFQAEALFLAFLAGNEKIREATTKEGVAYTYVVEAQGGSDRDGLSGLPKLKITLPTLTPSHAGLAALEEELRREGTRYDRRVVRSYTVKSADGSQVLARYQNHTFKQT